MTVIVTPMSIEARAVRAGSEASSTIVSSGIGMAKSRTAGPALAALGEPVVVTGFAGGLRDDQRPGQVVVATEVRVAGGAPGGLPLPAAPALAEQLRRAVHDVVLGPIISSRHVARGAARRKLAAGGAVAV